MHSLSLVPVDLHLIAPAAGLGQVRATSFQGHLSRMAHLVRMMLKYACMISLRPCCGLPLYAHSELWWSAQIIHPAFSAHLLFTSYKMLHFQQ